MKILDFSNFKLNEELEFKMVRTDYEKIKTPSLFPNISGYDDIYRFVSNKGNSYDVYFSLTNERDHILSNGKNLHSYNIDKIPTIFFSLTERGLDSMSFDKLTGNDERLEIMGKVVWLINEYDKINNFSIYSIGEVNAKKFEFYSRYLHNISQFKIFEGDSDNYNGKKCYYLVNENRR